MTAHEVASMFIERATEHDAEGRPWITLSRKQLAWLLPLAYEQGRQAHADDYYVEPAWEERREQPTYRVRAYPGRRGGRLEVV